MNNPYQPPAARVEDPLPPADAEIGQRIAALDVSPTWKTRFTAIHQAGGPKLPRLKSLEPKQRRQAMRFNFLAFLFGPLYYIAKGMWRRGLALLALVMLLAVVITLGLVVAGLEDLANAVGFGLGVIYAMRANLDFYKKMVLRDNGWW